MNPTPSTLIPRWLGYLFGTSAIITNVRFTDSDTIRFELSASAGTEFVRPTYLQIAGITENGNLDCLLLLDGLQAQVRMYQVLDAATKREQKA